MIRQTINLPQNQIKNKNTVEYNSSKAIQIKNKKTKYVQGLKSLQNIASQIWKIKKNTFNRYVDDGTNVEQR